MKSAPHFTVLTPHAFITDVAEEAKHAKKRVWAQAMDVEPGEIADIFFSIFPEAARRGIDTRFHADYYSLLVTDGVFHYWPFISDRIRKSRKRKMAAKQTLARTLTDAGVQFRYTNPPTFLDTLFPVRGRNHMKIVVIDDSAWIGGINFSDENFKAKDSMVKLTDTHIVSEIAYIYKEIDEGKEVRDMAITCNDETTLLVDGGRINRSIILRHAVTLINEAKYTVKVITPLIPDADLLLALKNAMKRGVTIQVTVPQSTKMSGIYVLLDEFNGFMMRVKGIRFPISFKSHMIHAKILIVDEREVIVGSHNFSSRGVRMGTEEIALQSRNKVLTKNLLQFYHELTKL